MAKAKEGDVITSAARTKLARAMGNSPLEAVCAVVSPQSSGRGGQWFCIDCGDLPQNNWAADTHERERPKHRLAWRSGETGKIEAP